MTYLGFDFGLKRIGIATGNAQTLTVMPLCTVNNRNGTPDWQAIDNIIEEWAPTALIVGHPLQNDGTEQAITPHATGFSKRLSKRYGLPVHRVDEHYTSIMASDLIREGRQQGTRKQTQRQDIDKIAAAVILERWLGQQTHIR